MQDAQNEAMWDRVMDLLRNDPMRRFRIAIETDSTIQPDEMEEKQKRIEFLEATGTFMRGALELISADKTLTPLVTEMLMFGVRGFRAGRELEERFEEVMDGINQVAQQPQQPPPNPEMMKAEAKIKADQQSAQIKAASEKQKMQGDQQKHQQEMQQQAEKFAQEMRHLAVKQSKELELMDRKAALSERLAASNP